MGLHTYYINFADSLFVLPDFALSAFKVYKNIICRKLLFTVGRGDKTKEKKTRTVYVAISEKHSHMDESAKRKKPIKAAKQVVNTIAEAIKHVSCMCVLRTGN